ncbi:MAG: hypothetical protein RR961_08630 [Eubacterium sp.]
MRIGVPYELFWTLSPSKLKPFIKANEDRISEKNRIDNINAWRQGLYIREAIASCIDKKAKYPKMPFGEEDRIANDPNQQDKIVEQRAQLFSAQMEVFNQKFRNAEPASQKSGEDLSTQTME